MERCLFDLTSLAICNHLIYSPLGLCVEVSDLQLESWLGLYHVSRALLYWRIEVYFNKILGFCNFAYVQLEFQSYNKDEDDYQGYDYSLSGKLSAVRIVFLYRFIQEVCNQSVLISYLCDHFSTSGFKLYTLCCYVSALPARLCLDGVPNAIVSNLFSY